MIAMARSSEPLRGTGCDHLERLEPVAEVVPHYDELVPDLNAGTPIVLTDGGTRIAVIVAWERWTLQHERYLNAAALGTGTAAGSTPRHSAGTASDCCAPSDAAAAAPDRSPRRGRRFR